MQQGFWTQLKRQWERDIDNASSIHSNSQGTERNHEPNSMATGTGSPALDRPTEWLRD